MPPNATPTEIAIQPPLVVQLQATPNLYQGAGPSIRIADEPIILLGPNGTGKTSVLRQLKTLVPQALGSGHSKKVRFLAAGRSSPLEQFRAAVHQPFQREQAPAYVGHTNYVEHWDKYESSTGEFLTLERRADLRLKVEARLQAFLQRAIKFTWGQNGLGISIIPSDGGTPYHANDEASGILQLVPLLAAIYNDEVGCLIIDEPEISLHPQYQSFILQELVEVSGDPRRDSSKKIVIIATHSPSMLDIRSAMELTNFVFFNDKGNLPIQISIDAPELRNRKLTALISRLTATHRIAFFARNVLLVEGPTDEIIVTQLSKRLGHPLLPSNTQVVPVTGKGEFVEAIKLFDLMGKRPFVIADLDALTDSNTLVNKFNAKSEAIDAANDVGAASLIQLDASVRAALAEVIREHWAAIEPLVQAHHYWSECPQTERTDMTKRRATLSVLMQDEEGRLDRAIPAAGLARLKSRFIVLFTALEKVGCFVLRRGTIEDYFGGSQTALSKPEAAAEEAFDFLSKSPTELESRYADVLRALRAAAPVLPVDENQMLRERLGAVLGAVFQTMENDTSNEIINSRARSVMGSIMDIFSFENCSSNAHRRLRVNIVSDLFRRDTFPFEIAETENATAVIRQKLPSV